MQRARHTCTNEWPRPAGGTSATLIHDSGVIAGSKSQTGGDLPDLAHPRFEELTACKTGDLLLTLPREPQWGSSLEPAEWGTACGSSLSDAIFAASYHGVAGVSKT